MARDQALIEFLLLCLMPTDEWEANDNEPPDDPDDYMSEAEE
jgi:hypothetical protein